jgi:hypothetical protein
MAHDHLRRGDRLPDDRHDLGFDHGPPDHLEGHAGPLPQRSEADLWIFDSLSWSPVEASFVAHQRLMSERAARLGFAGLAYHTAAGLVDLVAAGGIGNVMPANTAFGLDTSSVAIYTFPGQEFVPFHSGDGMRPINQDAVAQGIVWSGQFVVENPLSQIRLETA